jgi:hypothetical protein
MGASDGLKLLLSFLRFVLTEAPKLAPEVIALAKKWTELKNIPAAELEAALDPNVTRERVAEADRAADELIDTLWPKGL